MVARNGPVHVVVICTTSGRRSFLVVHHRDGGKGHILDWRHGLEVGTGDFNGFEGDWDRDGGQHREEETLASRGGGVRFAQLGRGKGRSNKQSDKIVVLACTSC